MKATFQLLVLRTLISSLSVFATCPADHFDCLINNVKYCLPVDMACDGVIHCHNGSDESVNRCGTPCRDPGYFMNGRRTPSYSNTQVYYENAVIHFHCSQPGFILDGSDTITCIAGAWTPYIPVCRRTACTRPVIKNGNISSHETIFTPGQTVDVICKDNYYYPGYYRTGQIPKIKCVRQSYWTMIHGEEIIACKRHCPSPPILTDSTRTVTHNDKPIGSHLPVEGDKATYYCKRTGYIFEGNQENSMTTICENGVWIGALSNCVIAPQGCEKPPTIENGKWYFVGMNYNTQVGAEIEYECNDGFTLIGNSILKCQSNKFWSHSAVPPRCVKRDIPCSKPPSIEHSYQLCQPASEPCRYYTGVDVIYFCEEPYYKPLSSAETKLTCNEHGIWEGTHPVCVPVGTTLPSTDNSSTSSNPNTMTIVIATSGTIIGVLVIVLVTVFLQRRKPVSRLWHTSEPSPPAYSRQRIDSIEEHDQAALINGEGGFRVVLPSYDEAVKGRMRRSLTSPHHNQDYRPLPRIASGLQSSDDLSLHSALRDDTSSNHPSLSGDSVSVRRQSTLTLGTNRDNLSENFGSIDTMNVSDTSTAITIGTYDSHASNPSLTASYRAAAGSILSQDTEENEAVPLLEGTHANRTAAQDLASTTDDLDD